VVLDIGTGVVAVGKLTQARKTGQPIPPGWALDSDGNPTTDPARAEIPLPLGGPKGSGLALMFELITSLIVANPILADHLDGTPRRPPPPPCPSTRAGSPPPPPPGRKGPASCPPWGAARAPPPFSRSSCPASEATGPFSSARARAFRSRARS